MRQVHFTSNVNNLNTEWLLSTRLDYNFSDKDRLFGRYKMDRGVQATGTDPINAAFNATSIQPEYEGQINDTHIFNGTTVNQLIFGGLWYKALFTANNLPLSVVDFPDNHGFQRRFDYYTRRRRQLISARTYRQPISSHR